MANPSFYFTLFKKFQVLNHVPSGTVHAAAAPSGGFGLNDPGAANSVFGQSNRGSLLGASTTPADSPLWAVLNSRAAGNAGFAPVNVGGVNWPTMPPGTPLAWQEFQINAPAPKLVDAFASWITAGKIRDIPNGVIASMPADFAGPDAGVVLFVCSMPGDQGVRPGVPSNYWATSLIFLVDPATGNTVNPPTLNAGSEYYVAAIIGNRGNTNAGRFINHPPALQAAASVMVWNTLVSPGVQLPSLSNLDLNDTNGIYEQYFLRSGRYDVVGFRMNVQTTFNGIVAALNDAVSNGLNLGGLTPEQWVHGQSAHLCVKVVVREQGTSFPNFGDTPDQDRRLAQKNLAPFEINLTSTDPTPNIIWKNFIVGQPLFFRLPDAGRNTLILETKLQREAFQLYFAIPKENFERFFRKGESKLKGFKQVPYTQLAEGKLGERARPFPEEAVILQSNKGENGLEIPPLDDGQFLAMSLGIEYNAKKLKPGPIGEITVVHKTLIPKLVPGTRCFEIEQMVAGGFTFIVTATDHRLGPKGEKYKIPDF
ncbi:hypothetical protein L0222_11170 [bacterium]|nr:hypothetical protein [bacterium]